MIHDDESGSGASYWPSVSDLFMTLFIIAVAMAASVLFVFLPNPDDEYVVTTVPRGYIESLQDRIIDLEYEVTVLQTSLHWSKKERSQSEQELAQCPDQLAALRARLVASQKEIFRLERELVQCRDRLITLRGQLDSAQQERSRIEQELNQYRDQVIALRSELDSERRERSRLKEAEDQRRDQLGQCIRERDDKPPIITIADSGVFFPAGSAVVTPAFESYLHARGFDEIASEIIRRNSKGALNVDTLEVIGHTDGIPLKKGSGNLDAALPKVLAGTDAALTGLIAGSNNDLGLLRALAIKQAWQRFVAGHAHRTQIEPIKVRTYSAGQTLPVEPGRFDVEDARARRIELRLTKLPE